MTDHYTITLAGGKFTVIDHRDRLEYLRDGRPAQPTLPVNCEVIFALVRRIEELEMAIGEVLDGTLGEQGLRERNGLTGYRQFLTGQMYSTSHCDGWEEKLRSVLNQKGNP